MNMPVSESNQFCMHCGAPMNAGADICPVCGGRQTRFAKPKSRLVYILLAVFIGTLGLHNFYAGYTKRGIIQLVVSLIGAFTVLILIGAVILTGVVFWAWAEAIFVKKDAYGEPMV